MTLKSKLYDLNIARRYDAELAEATRSARLQCVPLLRLNPGDAVLDLGCGTGLNQPYLAQAVGAQGKVVGVDASPKMLAQAEARARDLGYAERLTLIEADARRLPQLAADHEVLRELNGLLITLFLSVVPDWESVFADAFALLGDGGRCVIMDTYWRPPLTWQQRWMCWRYAAHPGRPGFRGLQPAADFEMENFPPDTWVFYIASGSKGLTPR